jgi:hypothetical protein
MPESAAFPAIHPQRARSDLVVTLGQQAGAKALRGTDDAKRNEPRIALVSRPAVVVPEHYDRGLDWHLTRRRVPFSKSLPEASGPGPRRGELWVKG